MVNPPACFFVVVFFLKEEGKRGRERKKLRERERERERKLGEREREREKTGRERERERAQSSYTQGPQATQVSRFIAQSTVWLTFLHVFFS